MKIFYLLVVFKVLSRMLPTICITCVLFNFVLKFGHVTSGV